MKLATAGDIEIGAAVKSLIDADLPDKVEGITRPEEGKTVVEGGAEFTENGMTMGNTVVEDGAITVGNDVNNQTIINGGTLTLNGKDVGKTIGGIERVESTVAGAEYTTIIENGALKISDNGYITNGYDTFAIRSDGSFEMTELNVNIGQFVVDNTGVHMNLGKDSETDRTFDYKGSNGINLGKVIDDIDTRLDDLEYKTQNINGSEGTTAGGEGGTAAGEGNKIDVPATDEGHTGINGNVTVGGEINAGEIVVGDKYSENKTTITDGSITTDKGDFGSEVTVGDKTTITSGNIIVGADGDQTTINGGIINTGDINAATGDFSESVTVGVEGNQTTINGGTITTGNTTINGSGINTGNITAGTGTIGGVGMKEGTITAENGGTIGGAKFDKNGMTVGDTTINDGNITVKGDEGKVEIGKGDVAIFDETGEKVTSIQHNYDEINRVEEKFDGEVNRLDNRITKVEDRIDKVGAMSAAIANLRTMGYDPAAPTEIAVGVGQYRSETGVALGMFHYPNRDFMLSLSVSTSGDEVMGGIGATWKFGRKSPEKVAEIKKAQAEADARRAEEAKLAKAEAMKQAAKEAKIKAQQERHAKLAAERAAQAEAAK